MARFVLDTSAYARFRSGHSEIVEMLTSATIIYVPTIVLGELRAGFLLGTRRKENEFVLEEFLGEPFVEILNVTTDVSKKYGHVFSALRNAGTPIPTNDIWIAASALDSGAHLLTFDTDFQRVKGLDVTILS